MGKIFDQIHSSSLGIPPQFSLGPDQVALSGPRFFLWWRMRHLRIQPNISRVTFFWSGSLEQKISNSVWTSKINISNSSSVLIQAPIKWMRSFHQPSELLSMCAILSWVFCHRHLGLQETHLCQLNQESVFWDPHLYCIPKTVLGKLQGSCCFDYLWQTTVDCCFVSNIMKSVIFFSFFRWIDTDFVDRVCHSVLYMQNS